MFFKVKKIFFLYEAAYYSSSIISHSIKFILSFLCLIQRLKFYVYTSHTSLAFSILIRLRYYYITWNTIFKALIFDILLYIINKIIIKKIYQTKHVNQLNTSTRSLSILNGSQHCLYLRISYLIKKQ